MKISKRQFKAALNVAHEAGFNSGRECTDADWVEHNFGNNPDDLHWRGGMDELIQDRDKVVKRIVKHEAKHAKMRKLKNVRKHWNVASDYLVRGELGVGKSATLPDLLAEYDFEGMDSAQVYASLDPTSTTSDNNESNASKLNETPTKEDV
jgi:hypothetical protein